MDERILQTLSGSATPSVEEQVRRWRLESPENEAYYQVVAFVWSATAPGEAAEQAASEAVAPADPQVILAEADRRRAAGEDRPRAAETGGAEAPAASRPEAGTRAPVISLASRRRDARQRRRSTLPRSLAIAAGIAALAVSVRLLTLDRAVPQPSATYAASAAAPRTVTLDDGSFVRLAAGSRMEARVTESERAVTLAGRAFFAVTHDAARPFVVGAGASETRVLGTRFEVAEVNDGVRTVVVDGLVAMSNAWGEVEVPAGSVAHAITGREPTAEHQADIRSLLDWPGGLLLFQGTPLARVAEETGSFYGRSVVVESDSLRALRISGSFEREGFEEVVQALCEAAGAICSVTADGAMIAPRER